MSGYRLPYTTEEDELILKTIVETQGYYRLRGVEFWIDFENCGITKRTWQSLKERFKKEIMPNIFNPKYKVPEVHKKMIYVAYEQTEKKQKKASKSVVIE